MTSVLNDTGFEALALEQAEVQARKFQGRQLNEYNKYVFRGQDWHVPRSNAVSDFLRPHCVDPDQPSLEGLMEGVYHAVEGQMTWVDMSGGRGLPMRELTARSETIGRIMLVNVDLFDYGLDGLLPSEIDYLERKNPGITDHENAPILIRADAQAVQLPNPANVITSIESMQYYDDPLAAMASWYNQLEDEGLLVISADHDWASWIRHRREPGVYDREEAPTENVLKELKNKGLGFAASSEVDLEDGYRPRLDPGEFRRLVIQKEPGTMMMVNAVVNEVRVSPMDYKAVYYEKPECSDIPLIEVTAA